MCARVSVCSRARTFYSVMWFHTRMHTRSVRTTSEGLIIIEMQMCIRDRCYTEVNVLHIKVGKSKFLSVPRL